MSRRQRQSKVEQNYIDMEFSSGDSNKNKSKQLYREENNNEIDELSKDLTEMGCIVDAVRRPPNICVETCVYESESDESINEENIKNDEDHYSDEFEEDKTDEEDSIKLDPKLMQGDGLCRQGQSFVKLSKSQSFMSSKPVSVSGNSSSSNYGSISIPPTRRINMSFTNDRLREIERHNNILLNKILSARNSRKSSIPPREPPVKKTPVPSAAVHRKKQQRKIDHENMILLKKIQGAKSSACSTRR